MKLKSIIAAITLVILFAGCSGNSSQITQPDMQINNDYSFAVGVSDRFPDNAPAGGTGMLGLFNLSIEPSNVTADITSIRKAALTDVLEVVDITNFLQIAPCTDCVKLKSIMLDPDNNLVISIGIKHPFESGDSFEPITGRNRADLHVLNVEGIVVSNSTVMNFPGINALVSSMGLINADGFSGYLDNSLDDFFPTDASVHPYILHFDDYTPGNFDASNPMGFESVIDPPPSGNLVMAMGCDYDYQDYVFKLVDNSDFIFAVGCTYAVSSASKSDRFTPEYRIPQHNKKSASEIDVEIITNDLAGEDLLSSAVLHVNVVDISHSVVVGVALNEMLADSSVGEISVEIPGVTLSPVLFSTTPLSGTGHDPADPLVFEGIVTNTAGGVEGDYSGLVKVTDSYSVGLNQSPLLEGSDGIKRVDPILNPLSGLFDITEFATYQTFTLSVATGIPFEVYSIDPESGDLDSGDLPVTIEGSGFDSNAQTKLVKTDNPLIELIGADVIVDINGESIECTFDMDALDGAEEGFYHVVVTNPDPPSASAQLDDAFEIEAFNGCIEVYDTEIYVGTRLDYGRAYASAFTHDGLLLSNASDGGYHLYGYDVTQDGDISGTMVVEDARYANNTLADLDVCDITGNIVYAMASGGWTSGLLHTFVAYDQNGNLIGEYVNPDIDHLQGIDTDDDGSIWTVGHTYINPDPLNLDTSPDQYILSHYTWDSVNEEYNFDAANSVNITATQKYNSWANIFDIAVSFNDDLVLVYSNGSSSYRGRIDAYDFSSGTPTHSYTAENLLPASIGSHGHYNWRAAGDIEIDHTDIAHEYCRVLISARNGWTTGQSFSKVDTSGNVIDQWLNPNANAEDRFFWSHAINTNTSDPDGIYMVATEDYSTFGGDPARFHTFEMPVGW